MEMKCLYYELRLRLKGLGSTDFLPLSISAEFHRQGRRQCYDTADAPIVRLILLRISPIARIAPTILLWAT